MITDYQKYRGKCKEYAEQAVKQNPSLVLVRGYYECPIWGKQQHWWCKFEDGSIFDPTKEQFPSNGIGDYIEFDGFMECSNCEKAINESEANIKGRYAFCSSECYGEFVGVI